MKMFNQINCQLIKLFFLFLLFNIIACNTNTSEKENNSDSLNTIDSKDTEIEEEINVDENLPEDLSNSNIDNEMKKYFTADELNFLHDTKQEFNNIKNSQDVAMFYRKKDEIIRVLYMALDKHDPEGYQMAKWRFLSEFLPGLCVNDGAEGIMIADYSLVPLSKKAKQTPEKDDDLFFAAISNGGKTYKGANKVLHFERIILFNCYQDLEPCYTEIGSGKVYSYLINIDKALETDGNFTEELKSMKEYAILQLQRYNYCAFSKKETEEYLAQIASEIKFEGELLVEFNKAKEHISSLSEDKFNCIENWNKDGVPY